MGGGSGDDSGYDGYGPKIQNTNSALAGDTIKAMREETKRWRRSAYESWMKMRSAQIELETFQARSLLEKRATETVNQAIMSALVNALVNLHDIAGDTQATAITSETIQNHARAAFARLNLPMPPVLEGIVAPPPDE